MENILSMASFGSAMAAIGHMSFLASFISWAQRSIIKLRMIAIGSLALGLIYNSWIHLNMPPDQGIGLVIAWLSIFLLQNIYMLARDLASAMEVHLEPQQKELLAKAFPAMHSADWRALERDAKKSIYAKGAILLSKGQACHGVTMIVSGVIQEERESMTRECESGTLWGELTYVMGENVFNTSPIKIIALSDVLLYEWSYETLRKHAKSDRFNAALNHSFVYAAATKHGLLWTGGERRRASQP